MKLAVLIIAIAPAIGTDDRLRATLPLLGRTVVEHQVRHAVGAGAGHVVLLVETMPAALIAAIDRLRRDGIAIEVARTIADAADRFHPDERLLLIADGCVVERPMLATLAALPSPALATVPDQVDMADHERIDGGCRWAGFGLLDGAAVRATAAMLGDWDAQSTLLRRAVQAGARRLPCADMAAGPPRIAIHAAALDGLDRRLLDRSRVPARRWPRRWAFAPVEAPAAGVLARAAVDPLPVAIGAALLAVLGVAAGVAGWRVTGMALALASGPAAAIAARLARMWLAPVRHRRPIERMRIAALACGLPMLAWPMGATWLLAAVTAVAGGVAAASACTGLEALTGQDGPPWLADADALAWGMAPVAVLAGWGGGITFALGYAMLSFAWGQAALLAAARVQANRSAL